MHTVTRTVAAIGNNAQTSTKAMSMSRSAIAFASTSASILASASARTTASASPYTVAPASTTSSITKTCAGSQFWCNNELLINILYVFAILTPWILGCIAYLIYLKYLRDRPKKAKEKQKRKDKPYPEKKNTPYPASFSEADDSYATNVRNERAPESGMPSAMEDYGGGPPGRRPYGGRPESEDDYEKGAFPEDDYDGDGRSGMDMDEKEDYGDGDGEGDGHGYVDQVGYSAPMD